MPRWVVGFSVCALLAVGFAVAFNKTQNYLFLIATLLLTMFAIAFLGGNKDG